MENQEVSNNRDEPINERIDQVEGTEGNGIEVSYQLDYHDVVNALNIYSKYVHGTKGRTIELIICAVLVVGFAASFIKDPTYFQGLALCIVSLLLGIFIWFMPRIQSHTQAKATAALKEQYSLSFHNDGVNIGEGDGLYQISYSDPIMAYENSEYILLLYKKSKIFCVPKRFIDDDLLNIRILLKNGLGERYHDLMMKEPVKKRKKLR